MKQKTGQILRGNIFPILIVALTISLSVLNYQPDTWLSGWDTLHPEFNFALNFKRIIAGVWRGEQGLGAVAAHSQMAELPRVILLFFLSLIFPLNTLRFLFIFLTLIAGPLGIYYFLEKAILKNHSFWPKRIAAFLGALFYLFNLGTLQHFYVPFEMFNVQYAALGWLFLFATQFLERQKKRDLILFSLASFLATPQAYAATLWYAYFFGMVVFLFLSSLPSLMKKNFSLGKRALVLTIATLVINAYWLLPNVYFILNHASAVPEAKINRLFSQEASLHSQDYANLKDIALLKNFLFNWTEHSGQGEFEYLLNEWVAHLENPFVARIGFVCFFFVLAGLTTSFWQKNRYRLPLFSLFLLSLIFLLNSSPFLGPVFNFFEERITIFREALRFPFTKFSILLMFSYAVYFAIAQNMIFSLIQKRSKLLGLLFSAFCFLILVIYMLPAFQGNLISPSMKVKIPDEYFQMFSWFNQQGEGRIAKLPLHTFWGWVYHDWGFQGAGFIWFGLKQPILERDFDRWSPYNEQYYQEMSYAVYSQDLPLLEQLLDKYQIAWILLDESIIAPGSEEDILFFDEIKAMFEKTEKIKLAKNFGEKLNVYQVNLEIPTGQSIQLAKTENLSPQIAEEILSQLPSSLNPSVIYHALPKQLMLLNLSYFPLVPELCSLPDENQVFGVTPEDEVNGFRLLAKNGIVCLKIPLTSIFKDNLKQNILIEANFDYQTKTDEKPFVCLFDERLGRCAGQRFPDFYFELEDSLDHYQLQFALDAIGSEEEKSILYKNIKLAVYEPLMRPKMSLLIQEAGYFDITALNRQPESCGPVPPKEYKRRLINKNGIRYIEYTSTKGSNCDHFVYPQLPHNQGYTLIVESRNVAGLPLTLCLTNHQTRHCDLYTNLSASKSFEKEVFLVPPMGNSGVGYDLNLNSYSVGNIRSVNHLKSIQILPLAYDWLQPTENKGSQNMVFLNQSFEKNWLAFAWKKPFSLRPLKSHFLVNGWANGWMLEKGESGTIVLIFLPQLLEYFGFFLLLIPVALLLIF